MISLLRNRPYSRESFERNLFILGELLKNRRLFHVRGVSVDGLRRVRSLPNGRVDLLSVDESTRVKANTLADFDGYEGPTGARTDSETGPDHMESEREASADVGVHAVPSASEYEFAENLIDLCVEGQEEEAVEALRIRVESDLRAHDFAAVDRLLSAIEVDRLPSSVLAAALLITLPAKSELSGRAEFLHLVEEWLHTAIGPDRTEALLANRR